MRLVVEARAVAVATDGGVKLAAQLRANLPILLSAQGAVHADGLVRRGKRGDDLAGVEAVARVEGFLDAPQIGIEFSEKFRGVLAAEAASVFAPHHAAVLADELHHAVRNLSEPAFVFRILEVERRPDVQAAHVHMPEHRVVEAVAFQQGTELADVGGQVFGRHAGVLHKRNRLARPLGVSEQPHALLAQIPQIAHLARRGRAVVARCLSGGTPVRVQLCAEFRDFLRKLLRCVADELDEVDGAGGAVALVGEEIPDLRINLVLLGKFEDFFVNRLNRRRIGLDQQFRRRERIVKTLVLDDQQFLEFRKRRESQLRLGDHRKGALGPGEQVVEVEIAVGVVINLGQVVARQEAAQLGKDPLNRLRFFGDNLIHLPDR